MLLFLLIGENIAHIPFIDGADKRGTLSPCQSMAVRDRPGMLSPFDALRVPKFRPNLDILLGSSVVLSLTLIS